MSALVYANKRGVTEAWSCVNGNAPLLFLYHKRMISGGAHSTDPLSMKRRCWHLIISTYPRSPAGTDSKGILEHRLVAVYAKSAWIVQMDGIILFYFFFFFDVRGNLYKVHFWWCKYNILILFSILSKSDKFMKIHEGSQIVELFCRKAEPVIFTRSDLEGGFPFARFLQTAAMLGVQFRKAIKIIFSHEKRQDRVPLELPIHSSRLSGERKFVIK